MKCVDTQVLIWGIKQVATPNRQHMIPRADAFLEECRHRRDILMIPSIVLSEFLAGYEAAARPGIEQRLALGFYVAPFDAAAAAIAAEIWSQKAEWQVIQQALGANRTTIKADISIVATAMAHRASRIVAEDDGVHAFSTGRIICDRLPTQQLGLFERKDGQ